MGRIEHGWVRPRLIAIIGGSGCGKTYLATMLQRALGPIVLRLALDDFYRDRSGCDPRRRNRINFDHPRAVDWRELEKVLKALAAGRRALAPCYDFSTHTRVLGRRELQPKPVVLVEGLWLCHRRALRRLFDYIIYIDAAESTRLRRRLARDVAQRGRTPESVRRQFFQTVAPMHRRFVAPQQQWSHRIIRRPLAGRAIARLARTLRQLAKGKKDYERCSTGQPDNAAFASGRNIGWPDPPPAGGVLPPPGVARLPQRRPSNQACVGHCG